VTLDDLWFLADRAGQEAAQAYHRLTDRYDPIELERVDRVSRPRFRTLAERIDRWGAPYGSHTAVHQGGEQLLLVRHDAVGQWVLPGGCPDGDESLRAAARRELAEEAGVPADYDGLAMVTRVEVRHGSYATWGVLPVFEARAGAVDPTVDDPDGEISAARWFPLDALPEDTRDRADLLEWRDRRF
jgi:8-oxo-dGTP diphosphatase